MLDVMFLMDRIKRNRMKIDRDMSVRFKFSPLVLLRYRHLSKGVSKYAQGESLDIGCGHVPYRDLIEKYVKIYNTLDRADSTARKGMNIRPVTYTADICKMEIPPKSRSFGRYDIVFSFEVLEHVESPLDALMNIHHLLKRGGLFVFTVPFMARIHDIPMDYHRFTRYAIEKWEGFKVVELKELGGLWVFVGHQLSIIFMGLCYGVPILWPLAKLINPTIVRLYLLMDKLFGFKKVFPVGYFGVLGSSDFRDEKKET